MRPAANLSLAMLMAALVLGCAAGSDDLHAKRSAAAASTSAPAAPWPPQLFFFVATDCPISNGYAPEMARIAREYEPRGVRTTFVYADPDVTPEAARRHAAEYGLDRVGTVVNDPTHESCTRPFGATLSPEAAVVVPARDVQRSTVAYVGRIDDLYVGFGKRRQEPTVRDLRNALDAVLAGKPVPPPAGKAIGCTIPNPSPAPRSTHAS